jgi:isopentenyl-diphosphate delta-isomerase
LIEHEVVELFIADSNDNLSVTPNPDEVMATRWVNLEKLAIDTIENPDIYTPWLRIYLAKHRDAIKEQATVNG